MTYNNDQDEYALPTPDSTVKKSEMLLPRYFRTPTNKKFLQSTLDQLVQSGVSEKINLYFGRKITPSYKTTDLYASDITPDRSNYQLEPALVVKDQLDNTIFFKDYNDYLNQIKNLGGTVENHDVLNSQEYYTWNPCIDWDKFVNYREYFWLSSGPPVISVFGQTREVQSVIDIRLFDNENNKTFIFSNNELVQNPKVILYRGTSYTFNVDTIGFPFSIRTQRVSDSSSNFNDGVSAQSVEQGTITFNVKGTTPEVLYYVADNEPDMGGVIEIRDIIENSEIDVEQDIIGRRQYRTERGFPLSNGMKVRFLGVVTPTLYAEGNWYVEGVGESIKFIPEQDLETTGAFNAITDNISNEFVTPEVLDSISRKDYITINRSSADRNLWSRTNRWFHQSVIEQSYIANDQIPQFNQQSRAFRPIIEFKPGLKLFNFGSFNKKNIDLVDDFTADIFSTIEGATGYNVDGVNLEQGMRVLFAAEKDDRYAGKIFKVNFITHYNRRQISLVEEHDSQPFEGETVIVLNGRKYRGRMFYYNNKIWRAGQHKDKANQPPLFDLFDEHGVSCSDPIVYPNSTFAGNQVLTYRVGDGRTDSELGFPISYRNIQNIGDIEFDFNLLLDSFTYSNDDQQEQVSTDVFFLRQYTRLDTISIDACEPEPYDPQVRFKFVNAWEKAAQPSGQQVIRQYVAKQGQTHFSIDVYDIPFQPVTVTKVTVNNITKYANVDYTVFTGDDQAGSTDQSHPTIDFVAGLNELDIVLVYTRSASPKNSLGVYEFPDNFEKNPLNNNIESFTLGEINDHVETIVTYVPGFEGRFPGKSNLRDLGDVTKFGKKFLQHAGPINLSLYHLANESANVIKSVDFARREYAKFKRLFIQASTEVNFESDTKKHVDSIFREINRNKSSKFPFYSSDMVPCNGEKHLSYKIFDPRNPYYPLTEPFDISGETTRAVLIYLNNEQLVINYDYTFNAEGFCVITKKMQQGDLLDIFEYDSTDACFVPPTPTKLGIYPKFIPKIFIDTTYQTPVSMIQGHDGSLMRAYEDYRDQLILELEKRIYNNIRIEYDPQLVDVKEFVSGEHRNTGIPKSSIDRGLIQDFTGWLSLTGYQDYTNIDFYNRDDTFTYNYSFMTSPTGVVLPGYWRAVYKYAFDTDRPHSHPWEMLGFYEKPQWWEQQYGPAPYTRNNMVLWNDLERGIISEPGKPSVVNRKFIRPGLDKFIPVDSQGNLLSPLECNYARGYVNRLTRSSFKFGDEGPVETAWRRSSEFPFSLLKSWLLNQPSKIMGLAFDRTRIIRNAIGHLVYKDSKKRIRLKDLVFPDNNKRIRTSGLVNFISDYMASNALFDYNQYKSHLQTASNSLAFKISGFTDKSKFHLILDSRTPLNQGNVFVPEENYKVELQTSSPVKIVSYGGVVIEKTGAGFVIQGYNLSQASFTYYEPVIASGDPAINVGSISESFITWDRNQQLVRGLVVVYNGLYYRCTTTHITSQEFELAKFSRLASLPVVGGRSAVFYQRFYRNDPKTLSYGTLLRTTQEVVSFLLGYGEYLKDQGFVFDRFNEALQTVDDWKLSAREFLFWTTQNWSVGAMLTVSPGAKRLRFLSKDSVVDNVFDDFYEYSLVSADGNKISENNINIARTVDNLFGISGKTDSTGIYGVDLRLVRTEHVIIIDNRTQFNDIIYNPETGYRQDRIKVNGYRTTDWSGGLTIPGFIFDEAKATDWVPWKTYQPGDLIRHRDQFFSARTKTTGTESFSDEQWVLLDQRPEPRMLTNLDYKINQFADFYDLDTDNFDSSQQLFAQHLIGYQPRSYLQNIINDSTSQYKFYQGFIREKGTANSLTKLFDALGNADRQGLEIYEEWAIKLGQYGSVSEFEEVEFLLDENKFKLDPQPVLLVDQQPEAGTDLTYRITPDHIILKPVDYQHGELPTWNPVETALKTAGYVRTSDVQHVVASKEDIFDLDFNKINQGHYIWVTFEGQSWNVYKHLNRNVEILKITPFAGSAVLTLNKVIFLPQGEIVGIQGIPDLQGFFAVEKVILNQVYIDLRGVELSDEIIDIRGALTQLVARRVDNLSAANRLAESKIFADDLIWVDSVDNSNAWAVIKADSSFAFTQDVKAEQDYKLDSRFGASIAADNTGNVLVVGSPGLESNPVFVYIKGQAGDLDLVQTLHAPPGFASNANLGFGESIALSPDAQYLVISAPLASNVCSSFRDHFEPGQEYNIGDIVYHNENLFEARRLIRSLDSEQIDFATHYSTRSWRKPMYTADPQNFDVPVMVAGNFPFYDVEQADHILIRPSASAYLGSVKGDRIYFNWNDITTTYKANVPLPIVGIFMNNPMEFVFPFVHDLQDGDEIVVTDVPNDGLAGTFNVYDNSDPLIAPNTRVQEGLKGIKHSRYFVKIATTNKVELYYNAQLTSPVDSSVGFTGQPLRTGLVNGYATKIDKPFDGKIPELDRNFFTIQSHAIEEKVDMVFYIESPQRLPRAGQRITTPTASAMITQVRTYGSLIIYANQVQGIFSNTGDLHIDDSQLIGEYTLPFADTVDGTQTLSGFWKITTPVYNPNRVRPSTAYGLVIQDIQLNGSAFAPRRAYNNSIMQMLSTPPFVISDTTGLVFQDETQLIRTLSYYSRSIGGSNEVVPQEFKEYIVRLPPSVTQQLLPTNNQLFTNWAADRSFEQGQTVLYNGSYYTVTYAHQAESSGFDTSKFNYVGDIPIVGVWLNDFTNPSATAPDISSTGLTYSIINRSQQPVHLWDGYITYKITDDAFERDFQIGDILKDGESGATAIVAFYQRDFNHARVYVDNASGVFSFGDRYISSPQARLLKVTTEGDLEMGIIDYRQISNGTSIGKLAVFHSDSLLPVLPRLDINSPDIVNFDTSYISNTEYHTWVETTYSRSVVDPSTPGLDNKNWKITNKITINAEKSPSDWTEEGAFFVYQRSSSGDQYELLNGFVLPNRENYRHLGYTTKIIKNNGIYRLVIGSRESYKNHLTDSTGDGRLYFVLKGTYNGYDYDWSMGKDPFYRGIHSEHLSYFTNDIVFYENNFYKALTNTQSEMFDSSKWSTLDNSIDFVGYLPNSSGVKLGSDQVIADFNTDDFGSVFDISDSGHTLATLAQYKTGITLYFSTNLDSFTAGEHVTIRAQGAQVFEGAVTRSKSGELTVSGDVYSLLDALAQVQRVSVYKDNGTSLNVFVENFTAIKRNIVAIYRLQDQRFVLRHEIQEPVPETQFGASIAVSKTGSHVAIGSPVSSVNLTNQGAVFVYKYNGSDFELDQTLRAPNNEVNEHFGQFIDFDGEQLVVASANGDITLRTTIDKFTERDPGSFEFFGSEYVNSEFSALSGSETTFDSNFTRFAKIVLDSGTVYIYEMLKDKLIFGQRLDYRDYTATNFGKNLLIKGPNVYIKLPAKARLELEYLDGKFTVGEVSTIFVSDDLGLTAASWHGFEHNVTQTNETYVTQEFSDDQLIITNSPSNVIFRGLAGNLKYDDYIIETTLIADDTAQGTAAVVIAFVYDDNGNEHTLSVVRSVNSPNNVITWGVIYNFRLSSSETIIDQSLLAPHNTSPTNGWSTAGSTKVSVRRRNNVFNIVTSQFGTEDLDPDTSIHLDLDDLLEDHPNLSIFKQPGSIGFGVLGANISFVNSSFINFSNKNFVKYTAVVTDFLPRSNTQDNPVLELNGEFIGLDSLLESPKLLAIQGSDSRALALNFSVNADYEGNKIVVYTRPENAKTWRVYREPNEKADISKFRGCFVYDKVRNQLLTSLDILDPIAGKIPGLAEQELAYKTPYDPATYNVGNNDPLEKLSAWGTEQTGRLWWDLSTVRYIDYYQGDIVYSRSVWNMLAKGSSIDVYEWVETTVEPEEWDLRASKPGGRQRGYSGTSKYGNDRYVTRNVFDRVSQTFSKKYFFWVKNRQEAPDVSFRQRSAASVSELIQDPGRYGLPFINILGKDRFILNNISKHVSGSNTVMNLRYWNSNTSSSNIHNQYQIISDGLANSRPHKDIETKWFDSLIGKDLAGRAVPDQRLSARQRYGILNDPRQSWFVDRQQALKQFITRVNEILREHPVTDRKNIQKLHSRDNAPIRSLGFYDYEVMEFADLQEIPAHSSMQAEITATTVDGKITQINISQPGRGYKNAPSIKVNGTGRNLKLSTVLDPTTGKIDRVTIENPGSNYLDSITLEIRPLAVLVHNDASSGGTWAIYHYQRSTRSWIRTMNQQFNTANYWNTIDWYQQGLNAGVPVNFVIEEFYQLPSLELNIGDIVKIETSGSGRWTLIQKVADNSGYDISSNFTTIAIQHGTIELSEKLYTENPDQRVLRNILEVVRDHLLNNELSIEYNQLFFSSLRYVFSEQLFVDWAFKTSFVKARHNVGSVEQRPTFQNDSLPSYEEYIKEVKPYKTTIREFVSKYDAITPTQTAVTDFDLEPFYDANLQQILAPRAIMEDGQLVVRNFDRSEYPRKFWVDNYALVVDRIDVIDGGSGFVFPPTITITGGNGTDAQAVAHVTDGSITYVEVTHAGSGYTSTPSLTVSGPLEIDGTAPVLSVKMKNNLVRSFKITQKFDRVWPEYYIDLLQVTQGFVAEANVSRYVLKWPMDLRRSSVIVKLNGIDALGSDFRFSNITDNQKSYTRKLGVVEILTAVAEGTQVEIRYLRNVSMLNAADRINFFYDPAVGNYGKVLSQLMEGVDYGGVIVDSFSFDEDKGWDVQPWFTASWDSYEDTYDEQVFSIENDSTQVKLYVPLEPDMQYNVYVNNSRVDDPDFGNTQSLALTIPDAVMIPLTTESTYYTSSIDDSGEMQYFFNFDGIQGFESFFQSSNSQKIVIRKYTYDGSFMPTDQVLDSIIEGGNLAYGTATGLRAEDINVDGDSFMASAASAGPEELVPGNVFESFSISVIDSIHSGGGLVAVRNFKTTGSNRQIFNLRVLKNDIQHVLVKLEGQIIDPTKYTIDQLGLLELSDPAEPSLNITIATISERGYQIHDIGTRTGNGSQVNFDWPIEYSEEIKVFLTVNGSVVPFTTTDYQEQVRVVFEQAPAQGSEIYYSIYSGGSQPYSEVIVDIFESNGTSANFELQPISLLPPAASFNMVVTSNSFVFDPGFIAHFDVVSQNMYILHSLRYDLADIEAGDFEIFADGTKLTLAQFNWNSDTLSLTLANSINENSSKLIVTVPKLGMFTTANPGEIILDQPLASGVPIHVFRFVDTDSHTINMQHRCSVNIIEFDMDSEAFTKYNTNKGVLKLPVPVLDPEYVWVFFNGTQLTKTRDFTVSQMGMYIDLNLGASFNDQFRVMYVGSNPISKKIGFRLFKDMVNRTRYHRLNENKRHVLSRPLNWYDTEIHLVDSSDIAIPIPSMNRPGVIFIQGERIEYLELDGTVLRHLRRATLGTGMKETYPAGTVAIDQSYDERIRYSDYFREFPGTAGSNIIEFSDAYNSKDVFEVFVSRKRLRKAAIKQFDWRKDQDSPEGDVDVEADFDLETPTQLRVQVDPSAGASIIAAIKKGGIWFSSEENIRTTNSEIGQFIIGA